MGKSYTYTIHLTREQIHRTLLLLSAKKAGLEEELEYLRDIISRNLPANEEVRNLHRERMIEMEKRLPRFDALIAQYRNLRSRKKED